MIRFALRLLAVVFLLTTASLTHARRVNSGWIAFTSHGADGDRAVFIMTGDGRAQRQVTPFDVCGNDARWSPDGRRLALLSACLTQNNLLFWGGDSFSRELPYMVNTDWSPDGTQLVAQSGTADVYIVDAKTGDMRLLVSGYGLAQWSPDGEWIYARPSGQLNIHLARIHSETGEVETVLTAPLISPLSWSPDGRQIAVVVDHELALMTPDGSRLNAIPVDMPAGMISEPHWSPDGEWIAFFGGDTVSTMAVYRVRPDGRDLQRLTTRTGISREMQWSPDGEWLVFRANYDDTAHIFHMRADGSSLANLTPESGIAYWPQYAPIAGLDWHPALMSIAVLGMFLAQRILR